MIRSDFITALCNKWERAVAIPELGGGGAIVAPNLVWYASRVPRDQCLVETGPWLGSTTAFLAIGAWLNNNCPVIHSYDKWVVDWDLSRKMLKHTKIRAAVGKSLQDEWYENTHDFGVEVIGHQGDATEATPPEEKIGLFVDDCTSGFDNLDCLFGAFGSKLAIGCPVLMMDYYFAERHDKPEFFETVEFFESMRDEFEGPVHVGQPKSTTALFIYKGGLT